VKKFFKKKNEKKKKIKILFFPFTLFSFMSNLLQVQLIQNTCNIFNCYRQFSQLMYIFENHNLACLKDPHEFNSEIVQRLLDSTKEMSISFLEYQSSMMLYIRQDDKSSITGGNTSGNEEENDMNNSKVSKEAVTASQQQKEESALQNSHLHPIRVNPSVDRNVYFTQVGRSCHKDSHSNVKKEIPLSCNDTMNVEAVITTPKSVVATSVTTTAIANVNTKELHSQDSFHLPSPPPSIPPCVSPLLVRANQNAQKIEFMMNQMPDSEKIKVLENLLRSLTVNK